MKDRATQMTEKIDALLKGASFEEVKEAAKHIRSRYMAYARAESAKAIVNFSPGDHVLVKAEHGCPRLPADTIGRIRKLGTKNLVVDFGIFQVWRIPPTFVEPAPKGAKVLKKHETYA